MRKFISKLKKTSELSESYLEKFCTKKVTWYIERVIVGWEFYYKNYNKSWKLTITKTVILGKINLLGSKGGGGLRKKIEC